MSVTPTRSAALAKELDAFIKAQVATGHYSNASEVVRTGLRLMIEREEARQVPQRLKAPANLVR